MARRRTLVSPLPPELVHFAIIMNHIPFILFLVFCFCFVSFLCLKQAPGKNLINEYDNTKGKKTDSNELKKKYFSPKEKPVNGTQKLFSTVKCCVTTTCMSRPPA